MYSECQWICAKKLLGDVGSVFFGKEAGVRDCKRYVEYKYAGTKKPSHENERVIHW